MPAPKIPDAEFMRAFRELGAAKLSATHGIAQRNVHARRRALERKYRVALTPPHAQNNYPQVSEHPGWINIQVKTGYVIIGSDAHLWPGPKTTAMRAFIHLCKELKPKAVIMNGDVMDFPRISRHPQNWEKAPSVQEEIEAAQDVMHEIEKAAGRVPKIWPLGNHDARFELRLASLAPEYAKVAGVHLKDHFAQWQSCWACAINDDIVVKHRHKNGIHAPHNSTLWAGKTTVTGHLHSQKIQPITDYRGTRWGVDLGCLADPTSRAFIYTECNPLNWRSGFGVLRIVDGVLRTPQLVTVIDEKTVEYCGNDISV